MAADAPDHAPRPTPKAKNIDAVAARGVKTHTHASVDAGVGARCRSIPSESTGAPPRSAALRFASASSLGAAPAPVNARAHFAAATRAFAASPLPVSTSVGAAGAAGAAVAAAAPLKRAISHERNSATASLLRSSGWVVR